MTTTMRRVAVATMLALGALIASAHASPARAAGEQLVVNVPETFEIDGRIYPAGPLKVRSLGAFTPCTLIVRVTVGRECLGVFLAHLAEATSGIPGNAIAFDRKETGQLTLAGFSVPGRRSTSFYAYKNRDARDRLADDSAVFVVAR